MDLSHQFRVPVPVEEAWAHFNDIASVAECFPGATVTSAEGDTFHGSCKVKLGPIALVYNGSGTFIEKDETTHRFVVDAKGKDKRGNGTAGATVTLTMAGAGGSTDIEVLTDLSVTGKPAQFGRGVMQDVSDKLLGQFVACLEDRFASSAAAPTVSAEPDQDAEPASQPTGAAAAPIAEGDQDAGPASAPAPSRPSDDAIDLGATVLPVLVRAYWKQGLAALAGLVLLVWILRRR
jgi:carbon monoxide dehydrogenase subunit G